MRLYDALISRYGSQFNEYQASDATFITYSYGQGRNYDSSHKNGIPKAMHQFVSMVVGKEEHQVIERAMTQQANEYTRANAAYWMEHELRQYPRIELDLAVLAAHTRQILLVGGRDAQERVSYQSSKALARQLGLTIVDVPGGHIGFMTSPAEFAAALIDALRR